MENENFKVTLFYGSTTKTVTAKSGEILSDTLRREGIAVDMPCGGNGSCHKCRVIVDGREELCCRYKVTGDISVTLSANGQIRSAKLRDEKEYDGGSVFIALDLGTTTIAAALCSLDGGIVKSMLADNPQRAYGSDVMSRIAYSTQHGIGELNIAIIERLNGMIFELLAYAGGRMPEFITLAGNTTMTSIAAGRDVSSMGVYPYTPSYTGGEKICGAALGLNVNCDVYIMPCVSAFVGADIVMGLLYAGKPQKDKWNILLDLGTNAETVIYSRDKIICTSAAAGPCFEGAGISCGMSAVPGALCSIDENSFAVIDNAAPEGVCATGLIDAVAMLIKKGECDESGYMENESAALAGNVSLIRSDIRCYQLAKAAVCSAVDVLMRLAGADFADIDKFFVAGGFSSKLNVGNAVLTGLFPAGLADKFTPLDNSCLGGLIGFPRDFDNAKKICKTAEYVDLSLNSDFMDLYVENMLF